VLINEVHIPIPAGPDLPGGNNAKRIRMSRDHRNRSSAVCCSRCQRLWNDRLCNRWWEHPIV